jgi:DNA-binding transcriptional ArsR family regulator
MVEYHAHQLDTIFHALGDATRRDMIRRLADGPLSVGALAAPFSMSLAAASKHIRALENAGLVRRQIRGRTHLCTLEPGPMVRAQQWLNFYRGFWNDRLDALETALRADRPKKPTPMKEKRK